jgi:hypothetical protein
MVTAPDEAAVVSMAISVGAPAQAPSRLRIGRWSDSEMEDRLAHRDVTLVGRSEPDVVRDSGANAGCPGLIQ